ncbi:hypothetical protein [Streptomyces sp. NPDC058773]|uniref:hypothetical protein n=1 Tax=Streptomyces sp. NPDC058773 TaxID=3346632 RepID=UPI0036D137F8
MGEVEHPANTGRRTPHHKRFRETVVLAVVGLLIAVGIMANDQGPWSGTLPDRACWGSLDRALLARAAPSGDAPWEITEAKDPWGNPECTVQRGDWQLSATAIKTPLKDYLWWGLGTVPLRHGLPGMIKTNRDRTDGWLHLPRCRNQLVKVAVPGALTDRHAAQTLAVKALLAVGNSRIARCGGKPFPVPERFDAATVRPVHLARGATPCGVADARTVRKWTYGKVSQLGGFTDDPVSRCAALGERDSEIDLGLFSALVLRDRAILDALSPTGVRARIPVQPRTPLHLTAEDLRYDRDAATELACAQGPGRSYVHVFASGSDPQYAAIKRAVLTKVAATMSCR